jgi:soluble lytic murein transglycosylase
MTRIPQPVAVRVIYIAVVTFVILFFIGLSSKVRYSREIEMLILEASRLESVHPRLLSAVIWKESRFNPAVRGEAGEIGLMQITTGAAEDWARAHGLETIPEESLWNPKTNITVGAWYLGRAIRHWKSERCRDPLPFALAEYNAGRSTVAAWVEAGGKKRDKFLSAITYPTTRSYVDDILEKFRH